MNLDNAGNISIARLASEFIRFIASAREIFFLRPAMQRSSRNVRTLFVLLSHSKSRSL